METNGKLPENENLAPEVAQAELEDSEAEPQAEGQETVEILPEEKAQKRDRNLRTLWTVGAILSILLNCILVIVVVVLVNQAFTLKKIVGMDLLGGLYANFVSMDQAHIKTTIIVQDQIPIKFDLGITQDTTVILTQDTPIQGARVNLSTGGMVISNAPADIVLPAGTSLPIHLDMTVPVEKSIPVTLNVPVDIALDQTDLHQPFTGLQQVVAPYFWMLKPEWETCNQVPLLRPLGNACKLLFWGP